MTTPKQIAANRANAQKSTGPRTARGKAIARENALTHGILARAVVPEALAPTESRADFDRLVADIASDLAPVGPIEALLVQQIAACYWRLARLYRAEAGAIARYRASRAWDLAYARERASLSPSTVPTPANAARLERAAIQAKLGDPPALRTHLARAEPFLAVGTDEQLLAAAHTRIAELDRQLAEYEHHRDATEDAVCSLPDPVTAMLYSRYETALHNQLNRAYARLDHLQHTRTAAGPDPSPQSSRPDPSASE